MNKWLIICIAVVLGGLLIFWGIKSKKIQTVFMGIGALLTGIVAFLFKSNKELKDKAKEQELQIKKQKDVIKAHDEVLNKNRQIEQNQEAKQKAYESEIKEAHASADVEKGISIGNDIVADFNGK